MKYSLLVTIVATLPAASEGLHFCFNEVARVTRLWEKQGFTNLCRNLGESRVERSRKNSCIRRERRFTLLQRITPGAAPRWAIANIWGLVILAVSPRSHVMFTSQNTLKAISVRTTRVYEKVLYLNQPLCTVWWRRRPFLSNYTLYRSWSFTDLSRRDEWSPACRTPRLARHDIVCLGPCVYMCLLAPHVMHLYVLRLKLCLLKYPRFRF